MAQLDQLEGGIHMAQLDQLEADTGVDIEVYMGLDIRMVPMLYY